MSISTPETHTPPDLAAPADAPGHPEPAAEAVAVAEAAPAQAAGGVEEPLGSFVEAAAPSTTQPAAPTELSPAACAAQLAERFPALFAAGRALPIKLRIQADIQQRAPGIFSKKSLSIFLHRYTTSTAYIKALVSAPQRVDLDGAPAGDIADEHRQAAVAELARRRAIVDARRAAERDAQRQAAASQRQQTRGEPLVPAPVAVATPDRPTTEQRASPPRDTARPRPPRHKRPHDASHQQRPHGASQQSQRAEGAHQHQRPHGASQPHRPSQDAQPPHVVATAAMPDAPALDPAEVEARRERAALLRSFDATTLTAANFCALKGLTPATLEPLLLQARQERAQRPAAPPARDMRHGEARAQPRQLEQPSGPGAPRTKRMR